MKERQKILIVLLLVPLFVFMAAAEKAHSANFVDFLGKAINFIILFGGLTYFLFKPVRNFLEKRRHDIEHLLEETEDSKREAEQKLEEAKSRLTGLEEEIARIKEEAEREGRREKEKIIQLAEKEAERIKSYTRQEIEMLFQAEIQHLREYIAELTAALAEEMIKKKLSPEDQSLLINKSIERLDRIYEKSNSD